MILTPFSPSVPVAPDLSRVYTDCNLCPLPRHLSPGVPAHGDEAEQDAVLVQYTQLYGHRVPRAVHDS